MNNMLNSCLKLINENCLFLYKSVYLIFLFLLIALFSTIYLGINLFNSHSYQILFITNAVSILCAICIFFISNKNEKKEFNNINIALSKLSNGDLTVKMKNSQNKYYNKIVEHIRLLVEEKKIIVSQLENKVKEINDICAVMDEITANTSNEANQISSNLISMSEGTVEQAQSISDILASMNSINEAINCISNNAMETVTISETTSTSANEGNTSASVAVNKINELKLSFSEISETINILGKYSSDIGMIVDLIKNIASQTNLLALNAAIEAARAGEAGKGFAVVANEVKKLAEKSSESTDKISSMIKEIQSKTNYAMTAMDNGIKMVDDSVNAVENVNVSLQNIFDTAKITSTHIQQISNEVCNLAVNSSEVAEKAEKITDVIIMVVTTSETISEISKAQVNNLDNIIAKTKDFSYIAKDMEKHCI